jgi:hypothetical protein
MELVNEIRIEHSICLHTWEEDSILLLPLSAFGPQAAWPMVHVFAPDGESKAVVAS